MTDTPDTAVSAAPEIIYHYTTQEACLRILESGELWASHIRYLNDATEFDYLVREAETLLNSRSREMDMLSAAVLTGYLLEDLQPHELFVACFCRDGDALSQWRAYGGRSGVSLGFDAIQLKDLGDQQLFRLMECKYWPDESIVGPLTRCIDTLCSRKGLCSIDVVTKGKVSYAGVEAEAFMDLLWGLAPIVKHRAFREESEWRLVSRAADLKTLGFRAGLSMPVPFRPLTLRNEGRVCAALRHVLVGPSPHPELARKALELRLATLGYKVLDRPRERYDAGVFVENSSIPFRNW